MAGRPWSSASTDLQLRIPLYSLLESVTAKPTRERLIPLYNLLESVTAKPTLERLHGRVGRPPLGPLVSGLYTLPPHVRYTPGVTLILVEFQISL
jgi:hypothetical protein